MLMLHFKNFMPSSAYPFRITKDTILLDSLYKKLNYGILPFKDGHLLKDGHPCYYLGKGFK